MIEGKPAHGPTFGTVSFSTMSLTHCAVVLSPTVVAKNFVLVKTTGDLLDADPRTRLHHVSDDDFRNALADVFSSGLDVPIWLNGDMVGVVCHDHVGPMRAWTAEEESFACLIGSIAALVRAHQFATAGLRWALAASSSRSDRP